MTIICCVKKGGRVIIGSDSFYGGAYNKLPISDTAKLFRVQNFVVGISGISNYRDAIEELNWKKNITKKKHAREFVKAINVKIKDMFSDGFVDHPDKEGRDGQMIIATPKKIFEVYSTMCAFEFDRIAAEGAGWKECLGALEALYDIVEDPVDIVTAALRSTCKLVPLCSEPLEIIEV